MSDTYQIMSEMLDNWLSDNEKEIKMAFIEKEILLEKMRKLYVRISALETEEYEAPQSEQIKTATKPETPRQYAPAKTLEEDVDLFFDTEHESYKHVDVEEDLQALANEIEEAQKQLEPEKEPEKEEVVNDHADIFDNLEEDDILQFIPPKSTLESSQPVQEPVSEEPEPVKITEKQPIIQKSEEPQSVPVTEESIPAAKQQDNKFEQKENPIQKPQQRSLNDLFNERREDHSISSQYQHAKVGDLTKAISINDKFIYIKELFHNRGEDFSSAIHQLNECQNMEEAFDCLDKLKNKYFWDSKADAYLSFCDLLRRKFS